MKTTVTSKNKANIILQSFGESLFQVMEYNNLRGYIDADSIDSIIKINESNILLKQIKVVLKNSSIKIQNDSLSYLKGDIEIKNKSINPVSIAKRLLGSREKTIKNCLRGTGEVYFKPSFKYFSIIELDDEEIVIDDEIFFVCEDSIKVNLEDSTEKLNTPKLKLKLNGSGIVILKLPVPEEEIVRYKLFNDKLSIIEEEGVLRSGSVDVEVTKINYKSKEYEHNYMYVYEGIGEVWVLPTLSCYEDFAESAEYYNENHLEESWYGLTLLN